MNTSRGHKNPEISLELKIVRKAYWENDFYQPLSFTSALRLARVLYGSGTDAGWVRLCDAAAPAAISSAANLNVHAGGKKGRNDTTGSPHDNHHPDLINTRASVARRFLHSWRHSLLFLIRTCSWCFASPLSSRLGPDTTKETKPHSRGLAWCLAYVFVDKRGFVRFIFGAILPDYSRSHGTNAGVVLNSEQTARK